MWESVFFWITLAVLATHELDAVARREWRILPLTAQMPTQVGRQVFIWAHVPLFWLLFWSVRTGPDSLPALLICGFAILHIALHWLFRNHPENGFANPSSRLLIWLPGLSGAAHLALVAWGGGE